MDVIDVMDTVDPVDSVGKSEEMAPAVINDQFPSTEVGGAGARRGGGSCVLVVGFGIMGGCWKMVRINWLAV